MLSPFQLDVATLEWKDNEVPTSTEYDDIYFSKQQGLAETEYVFLSHNQLANRWQQLDSNKPGHFTIAETGFGTGLNFLAACRLWQQHAPANWHLHFISVEKHPLTQADLTRSLAAWPCLEPFAKQLIDQYPPLLPGHHLLHLNTKSRVETSNIKLHLLLGEASQCFEQCLATHHPDFIDTNGAKVDAWFLDGFAPSKNPSMWSEQLFNRIKQLSYVGTTVATFTAAGIVRRGLQAAGFNITKVKGFGHKREMLTGVFSGVTDDSNTAKHRAKAPWALSTTNALPHPHKRPQHVAVIGGGIAGCTTAFALASRGIKVSLIERHAELAQEASGNAQAMLFTKLSTEAGKLSLYGLASYHYAIRFYQQLKQQQHLGPEDADFCGLLQLCQSDKQQQWLAELTKTFAQHQDWVSFLSAEQASQLSQVDCPSPGYFLKQSGWVSPIALCQKLSQHANITVVKHQHAIALEAVDAACSQWRISNAQQQTIIEADAIVIANSHDASQFSQCQQLPLKTIRGQVSELAESYFQQQPETVICHEGYITPAIDNKVRFGATFDIGERDKQLHLEDHHRNTNSLHQSLPNILATPPAAIDDQAFSGRANLRCTTPDYLPMVGPVANHDQFIGDYLSLNKDANRRIDIPGSYYPGLYLNVAHGSRGLTSTPLCAELIAAQLCSEPLPLPRTLIESLNPGRFIIRDIIRGKITTGC